MVMSSLFAGVAAWSGQARQASGRPVSLGSEGRLALLVQLGSGPEAGGEEATYQLPCSKWVAPGHHACGRQRTMFQRRSTMFACVATCQGSLFISLRICQASVWTLHSLSSFNTTRPLTRASMNRHEPSHVASCVPVSAQHRGTGTRSPSPSCYTQPAYTANSLVSACANSTPCPPSKTPTSQTPPHLQRRQEDSLHKHKLRYSHHITRCFIRIKSGSLVVS